MENKSNKKIIKNIILLIVLLVIYVTIDPVINILENKNRKKQTETIQVDEEIPADIALLNEVTKELDDHIKKNKKELDDFFFEPKIASKLKGILKSSTNDSVKIYFNDNLSIVLKKEKAPIEVHFKDNIIEIYHDGNTINGYSSDGFYNTNDVIVKEGHPRLAIVELRNYLIQGMQKQQFENLLNLEIKKRTERNLKILELSK